MGEIVEGTIVECVSVLGGNPVFVEVVSVNEEGVGIGYRVRRSDLARAHQGARTRQGAFRSTVHRLVPVTFLTTRVTKVVRNAPQP